MGTEEKMPEHSWDYCMRKGLFEEAWVFSDVALAQRKGVPCWHLPRHFQYVWNGSPLAGKIVLVRCYHGLGDTIQFIRYMPMLKNIAAKVIVWAQSRLIPLLQTAEGIDELWPLHDGTPEMYYDVDVELMELPHIFRTSVKTIPAKVPYLNAEPAQLDKGTSRLSVGLVWQSGDWDERRSVPFQMLRTLGSVRDVSFFILQANATAAGWDGSFGTLVGGNDITEDARIIKALDLVITVDTMIAHLAGALAKPVWTLLPQNADWRWMEERKDSPWYPTMRLFRQQHAGGWQPVVDNVAKELQQLAANSFAAT